MKYKVGDYVQFLNDTGGGRVHKIINNNIVEVKDNSGFCIPISVSELIIEKTAETVKAAKELVQKKEVAMPQTDSYIQALEKNLEYTHKIYVCFVPVSNSHNSDDELDIYIVNDTVYKAAIAVIFKTENRFEGIDLKIIPKKSKYLVETILFSEINDWENAYIQIIFFANDSDTLISPITSKLSLNAVNLYKNGSYKDSTFFDIPVYTVEVAKPEKYFIEKSNPKNIKHKTTHDKNDDVFIKIDKDIKPEIKIVSKKHRKNNPDLTKEVDLHAHELFENPDEYSVQEIFTKQIEIFKKELEQAIDKRLNKITFIHGKGNGRLKHEINELLKNKSGIIYYDASYQKYGEGATEIKII